MKKKTFKIYILYYPIYMTFWKKQNYRGSGYQDWGRGKELTTKEPREIYGVMEMFYILIVVVIT